MNRYTYHLLITSVSQKTSLINTIKGSFYKNKSRVNIFGADSNDDAIARHFVDQFWHMPLLDSISIGEILDYCSENQISIIIPTREGELSFFSKHKEIFKKNGIHVMVSDINALEIVQDKLSFYKYLIENKYSAIKTSAHINDITEKRFVVKERFGAGSKGICLNVTREEARIHSQQLRQPIFQPYINGTEYSIDVYVDGKGRSKGAIVRERLLVVNGESQITKTYKNEKLEALGMQLAEKLKLSGHVMFQVIVDALGNSHVVECNPRFGGASTLSIAAGLDSFYWFLVESESKSLDDYPFKRSEKELTQVRYAKDLIF